MKIKAVIVDDEAIARTVLQNYLAKYCPVVEVLGKAEHIKEAVPMIQSVKPDLVFLDVEMPFGNAFDVLEACGEQVFETIFITAYSEYSMKALNRSAAYYILKPIDISELVTAVNRVQETLLKKEELNRNRILLQNLKMKPDQQQVVLPTMQGFDVIKTSDISKLQAKGNFTEVCLTDGTKKLICKFLKHFDDILEDPFIRVHRSFIVNLLYVRSYARGAGGYLTLMDGTEVEVSPTYKELLLKRLGA
jgi:two-component system LytT family response regulator